MKLKYHKELEHDGEDIYLFELSNSNGCSVKITNYGSIITSLCTPDKNGSLSDIVLGYNSLPEYISDNGPHFGSIIGRFASRIAHGRFSLNEKNYQLACNCAGHHLHGGTEGFDTRIWKIEQGLGKADRELQFSYLSPDMEEGYPGSLRCNVCFSLNELNELKISYKADSDADTIVNFTHHPYFNLKNTGSDNVLDHKLRIKACAYAETDDEQIPTGEIHPVSGTPFDFTQHVTIADRLKNVEDYQALADGYDHSFVLDNYDPESTEPRFAASVIEPSSGRIVEILTTEPGLQFYTGNFMDGQIEGKGHIRYFKHAALCLETQHFPDSINQPAFPSVILKKGESFSTTTVFRFSVRS